MDGDEADTPVVDGDSTAGYPDSESGSRRSPSPRRDRTPTSIGTRAPGDEGGSITGRGRAHPESVRAPARGSRGRERRPRGPGGSDPGGVGRTGRRPGRDPAREHPDSGRLTESERLVGGYQRLDRGQPGHVVLVDDGDVPVGLRADPDLLLQTERCGRRCRRPSCGRAAPRRCPTPRRRGSRAWPSRGHTASGSLPAIRDSRWSYSKNSTGWAPPQASAIAGTSATSYPSVSLFTSRRLANDG